MEISKHRRLVTPLLFVVLALLCVVLAIGDMLVGTTHLSLAEVWAVLCGRAYDVHHATIVLYMRLPKVAVAILSGVALSASGLQMQTLFRNPLAGPYVLDINAGASLGVALFTLVTPLLALSASWLLSIGITGMAWLGSAMILMLVIGCQRQA